MLDIYNEQMILTLLEQLEKPAASSERQDYQNELNKSIKDSDKKYYLPMSTKLIGSRKNTKAYSTKLETVCH